MDSIKLLFAIKCKICKNEFIYCIRSRNDFRCYNCKKGQSVEAVQKEFQEMSSEEYQSFVKDIAEYEMEFGKTKEEDEL